MSDASTTESHATMGIPGSAGALSPAGTVLPPITKVIVAIHGIGSQRRSSTIRAVARRFGDRSCPPLPVMPLGFFYIGKAGQVHVSRLDAEPTDPLASIGFAEVFWADIPRAVVKEEDTLEETKAWASSVVSRAHALYLRNVQERQLLPEDFMLGAGVVEEIIETVAVMENLLTVAEKAGVFKFDLAPLLRDYVGDVQLVTDFKFYRDRIVYRFHDAMAQIVERFKQEFPGSPEIYVVAHSEGTVVSFLGLLQALAKPTVADPMNPSSEKSTDWIQYVRGFMTIGSPIDKHLALWPKLWEKLDIRAQMDDAGRIVLPPGGGTARPCFREKSSGGTTTTLAIRSASNSIPRSSSCSFRGVRRSSSIRSSTTLASAGIGCPARPTTTTGTTLKSSVISLTTSSCHRRSVRRRRKCPGAWWAEGSSARPCPTR